MIGRGQCFCVIKHRNSVLLFQHKESVIPPVEIDSQVSGFGSFHANGQPLQPVLSNPALTPAFDNVVPALFGALGLKYFLKGKKFAAIPLALSCAVCIFVPSLIRQTSVLLIVIGALTIGVSFVFYKKGALDE